MKPRLAFSLLAILLLSCRLVLAQDENVPTKFVSIQPMVWIDNLLPTEVAAFAGQFEQTVSPSNTAVIRVTWFRDPFFTEATSGSEGFSLSGEYRFYLGKSATGWHLGPFAEWVMYKFLGSSQIAQGPGFKHSVDVGAIVGHKWAANRITFDISARTSWYAPNEYPKGKFFPRSSSRFNSHLLVSVGYALN